MLALVTILTASISVNAVGNYKDSIVNIEAKDNSGGTPHRSIWRGKADYTSSWCENKKRSGGNLTVWVERTNNRKTTSVNTVDRYYGKWSYNGATKNSKRLKPGQHSYLKNYVKEDGYKYATVGYIMQKERVSYSFAWSPDSIYLVVKKWKKILYNLFPFCLR